MSDSFRVDATVATLYNIVERGGRPILMTHIGRPFDKKTGAIRTAEVRAGATTHPCKTVLQRFETTIR